MTGLTRRQRVCLEAVRAFQARTGTMPSVNELRVVLGLTSKSAAARLLKRLAERGAIKRVPGCARAIALSVCPHCGKELQGRKGRRR
jgi:SOS-response transcriptional repressor LexA